MPSKAVTKRPPDRRQNPRIAFPVPSRQSHGDSDVARPAPPLPGGVGRASAARDRRRRQRAGPGERPRRIRWRPRSSAGPRTCAPTRPPMRCGSRSSKVDPAGDRRRAGSACGTAGGSWRCSGSAPAHVHLSASVYLSEQSVAARRDARRIRGRVGAHGRELLRDDLGAPVPSALPGRASGGRARHRRGRAAAGQGLLRREPRVRAQHDARRRASSTSARRSAQREFVALCRDALGAACPRPAPPLRSLRAELDALEGELLAAYRPPASIDRHSRVHRARAPRLKEARELDAAGLRYGALAALPPGGAARRSAAAAGARADDAAAARALAARRRSTRASPRAASTTRSGALFLETRAGRARRTRQAERRPRRGGGDRRRRPAALLRRARPGQARAAAAGARGSPSRSCAGPTPETSPIRQVCWHRASSRSSAARPGSCPRTTATRRSRSDSA